MLYWNFYYAVLSGARALRYFKRITFYVPKRLQLIRFLILCAISPVTVVLLRLLPPHSYCIKPHLAVAPFHGAGVNIIIYLSLLIKLRGHFSKIHRRPISNCPIITEKLIFFYWNNF